MGAGRHPLWPFVRGIHHYDIAGMPAGVHVGMPSASVTMVLTLGSDLDLQMPAIGRRQMALCIAGLHDHPAAIHHDGTQRGIQLELAPLGTRALLGVPAAELVGTAVGLDDLLGHVQTDRLMTQLTAAEGWPARVALVERYLTERLHQDADHRIPRPEVVRAWTRLARSGGSARIGDVAAEVGWSARHLAQQFTAAVGVTPKTAGRLMRFHRSVTMIAGGAPIADAAARCDYADQAHLTREWRRLAGTTPARWPQQDAIANVQDATDGQVAASRA